MCTWKKKKFRARCVAQRTVAAPPPPPRTRAEIKRRQTRCIDKSGCQQRRRLRRFFFLFFSFASFFSFPPSLSIFGQVRFDAAQRRGDPRYVRFHAPSKSGDGSGGAERGPCGAAGRNELADRRVARPTDRPLGRRFCDAFGNPRCNGTARTEAAFQRPAFRHCCSVRRVRAPGENSDVPLWSMPTTRRGDALLASVMWWCRRRLPVPPSLLCEVPALPTVPRGGFASASVCSSERV